MHPTDCPARRPCRCPSLLKNPAYLPVQFKSADDYESYMRQNFPSLPEDAIKVRPSATCLRSPT